MKRVLVAAACAAFVALSSAPSVSAQTTRAILEEGDAIELSNKLAEATEEQDVCYGWVVAINDQDRGFTGEQGSSLGPSTAPSDPACTPSVVFIAELLYTSEMSEASDSATIRVESTLPGLVLSGDDFGPFGVTGRSLLGDNDDLALLNAVSALPLLVAEAGLAPAVQPEQTTGTIPDADRPTGGGGSDRFRTYGSLYFLAIALILGGVGWLVVAFFLRSMANAPPLAHSSASHPHAPDPTGDRPWTS